MTKDSGYCLISLLIDFLVFMIEHELFTMLIELLSRS
jgi:hypothetical protein